MAPMAVSAAESRVLGPLVGRRDPLSAVDRRTGEGPAVEGPAGKEPQAGLKCFGQPVLDAGDVYPEQGPGELAFRGRVLQR